MRTFRVRVVLGWAAAQSLLGCASKSPPQATADAGWGGTQGAEAWAAEPKTPTRPGADGMMAAQAERRFLPDTATEPSASDAIPTAPPPVGTDGGRYTSSTDVSSGPTAGIVIPVKDIIGGVSPTNNAKSNPSGGYKSNLNNISEFKYPATHGNQWGTTAIVNDHTYWDSPEGLKATHVPPPDPGGGSALLWPEPGEWFSYRLDVPAAGPYKVMTRFSSGYGPDGAVTIHMTVDDVSSGPMTLKPDDPKLWTNKYYQVGGWWGHSLVSGTSAMTWPLSAGRHVLKVFIDSFPKVGGDLHGNLWIRYFKLVKD